MKRPDFKTLEPSIRNIDIINLHAELSEAQGMKGTALIYAVSRTIAKLKPLVEAMGIDKCIPQSEKFKEFNKELHEIHKKYSDEKMKMLPRPDGKGMAEVYEFPWTGNNDNDVKRKAWMTEVEKLRKKYKDAIDEREKEIQEYNNFLQEPFPEMINDYLHKISKEKIEGCEVPESLRDALFYIVE